MTALALKTAGLRLTGAPPPIKSGDRSVPRLSFAPAPGRRLLGKCMAADPRLLANAIRALSMDAVQAANSGHPGMPMGMADVATILFTEYLKHDPADPDWHDRDRFVLSAGTARCDSISLLYLTAMPTRRSGDRELPGWILPTGTANDADHLALRNFERDAVDGDVLPNRRVTLRISSMTASLSDGLFASSTLSPKPGYARGMSVGCLSFVTVHSRVVRGCDSPLPGAAGTGCSAPNSIFPSEIRQHASQLVPQ